MLKIRISWGFINFKAPHLLLLVEGTGQTLSTESQASVTHICSFFANTNASKFIKLWISSVFSQSCESIDILSLF